MACEALILSASLILGAMPAMPYGEPCRAPGGLDGMRWTDSSTQSSEKKQKEPKLNVRLILSPKQTIWNFVGVRVLARVLVEDPKRELQCPEFTWEISDGRRSVRQSDCDPDDYKASYLESLWIEVGPGVTEVTVTLKVGKKEVRLSDKVEIHD